MLTALDSATWCVRGSYQCAYSGRPVDHQHRSLLNSTAGSPWCSNADLQVPRQVPAPSGIGTLLLEFAPAPQRQLQGE